MTTAYVAGATGYTGQAVVRQLAASSMTTIAHVRADSPALAEWQQRFAAMNATVDATAWQPAAIEASVRRHAPDVVFALLGTTKKRARAEPDANYETVDYGLTHMLLQAVLRGAPGARFIYLSSVGARADTSNEYLRVRGRIENELAASGLPYVIARPAIISGSDREERRVLERVAAVAGDAAMGALARIGVKSLHEKYRSISSERLARALIAAAFDPDATNRVLGPGELQRRAQ